MKDYPKDYNQDYSIQYPLEYLYREEGMVIPPEWNHEGDEEILVPSTKMNVICSENGFSSREWYNRWVLRLEQWEEPAGPKCPLCGKPVHFLSPGRGYRKFCSNHCSKAYRDLHREEYPVYDTFLGNGGGWGVMHQNPDLYPEFAKFVEEGGGFGQMWRNLDQYPNVLEFLAKGGAAGHMLRHIEDYPKYEAMIEKLRESTWVQSIESSWGKFGSIILKGEEIKFRSRLEYSVLRKLVNDCPDITSIQYEPLVLDYIDSNGNPRGYIPDYKVIYESGLTELIEVKYHKELESGENPFKFKGAKEYCRRLGWEFVIYTDWDLSLEEFLDPDQRFEEDKLL